MFADGRVLCDELQMEIPSGFGLTLNRGAAEDFFDKCSASGRYGFSVDDATQATGLGERSAKDQLRRLGKRVTRVARWRSFFVIKGEGDAAFGGLRSLRPRGSRKSIGFQFIKH